MFYNANASFFHPYVLLNCLFQLLSPRELLLNHATETITATATTKTSELCQSTSNTSQIQDPKIADAGKQQDKNDLAKSSLGPKDFASEFAIKSETIALGKDGKIAGQGSAIVGRKRKLSENITEGRQKNQDDDEQRHGSLKEARFEKTVDSSNADIKEEPNDATLVGK